ncbi:biotin synthase BioB [Clostridium chrysemydis]|uniref:biotin synthase BioB n=1 Tax=Clostridium chrysemydis TaxID=2665504 RepID=UPI0018848B50|nr:biotin synthase BioB [Clostridium chrysemydis]
MKFVFKIRDKVLKGEKISKEEAKKLYFEDLEDLKNSANIIRDKFLGNSINLCSIVNGKSGKCKENCSFCAQSIFFKTGAKEYQMLPFKEVLKEFKSNESQGVNRFSIVTSGRGLKGEEFNTILDYYKKLKSLGNLELCASHGIIDKESLKMLKKVGVKRYHHNLETSKDYFKNICITHSFEERLETIKLAKEAGLEVCSGGIIGLGETYLDRIDLAFTLRDLEIKSIPINILMKIKGTPLISIKDISEEDILRTIALFRFINPKASIRLAGGRNRLKNYGEEAFKSGASATITGNLLTTCGNKIKDDIKLIEKLGLRVEKL